MHPVLFELFGFQIPSFGVMMALGFVLGLALSSWIAKHKGLAPDRLLEVAPWLILSAVLGARLFYFVYFPDVFWQDPFQAMISRGGLVWYGGVLGCLVALLVVTRQLRIPFFKLTDIIVPGAALGLALGRIGCFLAGCCFGGPCALPWAVVYPVGHETHPHAVHPAPLYESVAAFVLAGLLLWVSRRFPMLGVTSWTFVVGYGIIRFVIEYTRGDRLIWFEPWDLSASQVMSLVGIVLGSVMIAVSFKNKSNNNKPANENTLSAVSL